ncbi:MAG: hypothetical protein JWP87_2498 [Labilithrix sp.]|nr:hypothetical protein [Labilithrix sp.]
MSFETAGSIADAVLLEGYVLYPYRSCSAKNRYRWTFGVLAPRDWSAAGGCEPWWLEAQVLVEGEAPRLRGRLRFLHVIVRRIDVPTNDGYRATERLDAGGRVLVPWEEGDLREIDFEVDVDPARGARVVPFEAPADERYEVLLDRHGGVLGRIVRTRAAVEGTIRVRTDRDEDARLHRVVIRVENVTPSRAGAERAEIMHVSCISAHLMLALDDRLQASGEAARFVSLLDPPAHAERAARACTSVGAYPVLVGDDGRSDMMLCSPIILYDHPQIAPESAGDFFDSTEIDAMLALRTRTLTPDEKVLARATDPRSAAILDRVDALDNDALARLHGVMRDRRAVASPPLTPSVSKLAPGRRVRLRLDGTTRRTDAQDLLYAGRVATIASVRHDVDGREYVLVTIDDDPAAEMHRWKGRFHYYYPEEVELLDVEDR